MDLFEMAKVIAVMAPKRRGKVKKVERGGVVVKRGGMVVKDTVVRVEKKYPEVVKKVKVDRNNLIPSITVKPEHRRKELGKRVYTERKCMIRELTVGYGVNISEVEGLSLNGLVEYRAKVHQKVAKEFLSQGIKPLKRVDPSGEKAMSFNVVYCIDSQAVDYDQINESGRLIKEQNRAER